MRSSPTSFAFAALFSLIAPAHAKDSLELVCTGAVAMKSGSTSRDVSLAIKFREQRATGGASRLIILSTERRSRVFKGELVYKTDVMAGPISLRNGKQTFFAGTFQMTYRDGGPSALTLVGQLNEFATGGSAFQSISTKLPCKTVSQ